MKKTFWINAVRAISISLVIIIHVSAVVILEWGSVSNNHWLAANLYNSISRISVPLFIIISGLLLLRKSDSLKVFFQKRLKRILLPWFFWGIVLLLVNNNFSISQILSNNFKILVIETYFGGFWFIPMLVGIYLLTPIIKPFVQSATNLEFKYFFIIWFVIASILPTLNTVFEVSLSISLPLWISYLGYFVGGYYLNEKVRLNKNTVLLSKIVYSINLLVTIIATYKLSLSKNDFFEYLYNYLSMPVVLMSFSSFIILKDFFINTKLNKNAKELINFFSEHSFGIFLSHALILKLLANGLLGFKLSSLSFQPLVSIPIISIIVLTLSSVLIAGLKKVPIIKNFAG